MTSPYGTPTKAAGEGAVQRQAMNELVQGLAAEEALHETVKGVAHEEARNIALSVHSPPKNAEPKSNLRNPNSQTLVTTVGKIAEMNPLHVDISGLPVPYSQNKSEEKEKNGNGPLDAMFSAAAAHASAQNAEEKGSEHPASYEALYKKIQVQLPESTSPPPHKEQFDKLFEKIFVILPVNKYDVLFNAINIKYESIYEKLYRNLSVSLKDDSQNAESKPTQQSTTSEICEESKKSEPPQERYDNHIKLYLLLHSVYIESTNLSQLANISYLKPEDYTQYIGDKDNLNLLQDIIQVMNE